MQCPVHMQCTNDKDIVTFLTMTKCYPETGMLNMTEVMVSTVTTAISLCPPTAVKLQKKFPDLSPIQWLQEVKAGEVSHLYKLEEIDNLFRLERNQYIADLLSEIVMEQRHNMEM